jgi:hypothetical protein
MISIGWRDMTIYASPGGPGRPAAYANYFIPENQPKSLGILGGTERIRAGREHHHRL